MVSRLMMVFVLAALMSGCASYGAGVVSNEGKAYIIKTEAFSQSMLLCDASSGRPVCSEQQEQ